MILLADSGSSKTDWVAVKSVAERNPILKTIGLNPYFTKEGDLLGILKEVWEYCPSPTEIHFYGAGYAKVEDREKLKLAFAKIFPISITKISIETDLLGAARGVFGNRKGIISILGTGASAGYYNGEIIENQVPSNGYLLGDYGSGAAMGLSLLKEYLKGEFPLELSKSFAEFAKIDRAEILNKVYKEAQPNRYLASLSPFLLRQWEKDICNNIICSQFDEYIKYYILKYKALELPIGIVGSIGFHYQKYIRERAMKHKIKIDSFLSRPIEALINYHCS